MSDNKMQAFESELKRLESRMDELVTVQKNEQGRARVEAMIGRLKAMEHGS